MKPMYRENPFLDEVKAGIFEIDKQGRVWRLKTKDRWGNVWPIKRKRAEYNCEANKYYQWAEVETC